MTLTLLLQLTDDEQLFAQKEEGEKVKTETQAATGESEQVPTAEWPDEAEGDG
jgi:hypothetical protein